MYLLDEKKNPSRSQDGYAENKGWFIICLVLIT